MTDNAHHPTSDAASPITRQFFDAQRDQEIERGRLASTWEEVALSRDSDGPIGRNSLPAALWDAVQSGALKDPDEIAVGLNDAWTGCEWPTMYLPADKWVNLFERTGFIDDGLRVVPLHSTMTLYRATTPGAVGGMSWTEDLQVALWFHRRTLAAGLTSAVYAARFAPHDLLAHFNYSTGEHEWVVRPGATAHDLTLIDTSHLSLPKRHPGWTARPEQ